MDQYCATGVCCGRMLICRVTVNLYYNVKMKLITSSYSLKLNIKKTQQDAIYKVATVALFPTSFLMMLSKGRVFDIR
jgi:hypothetical protein